MSKRHSWLALAVALALLVGALAPATALASRGGKPLDGTGDPNDPPPMEYGDPDPDPGGSPMQLGYETLVLLRGIAFDSLRIRFGLPISGALACAGTSKTLAKCSRTRSSR